ncbi:MAG: OmpA family protein [Gammaproteobacteria bacterium]|nr:OmpA family protein [Gammaproteobacteria bacterium]MBQ0839024.1 OmpA family protein [Gammaproteobacteria bacterium]
MNKVVILCFVLVLAACTSTDPYTGEEKTSNTAKGAGIGALAGALIGAAVSSKSDRGKGALIGAVGGAAIGGGVGSSMDKQEAALRAKLEGTGVRVVREGNNIRLVMPGHLTFEVDRHDVRSQFYGTLESVALVLKEFTKTNIRIGGHTDSTGSDSYNQTLSEQRAASVGQFLVSQGVMSGRVSTTGYGKRYPIASNDSAAGRQTNRRVELELVSF